MLLKENSEYVIGLLTICSEDQKTSIIQFDDLYNIKSTGGAECRLVRRLGSKGTYILNQNGKMYIYHIFKLTPSADFNSNEIADIFAKEKDILINSTLAWSSNGDKLSVDNFSETPGMSQAISIMKISA